MADFIAMYPQSFVEIEYEECRGIALGAIDYAKNLGFEPHFDFEKVKGFIEADIPYETKHAFGRNGRPFCMEGPDDDIEEITRILEK